jgi:hypothetical protein
LTGNPNLLAWIALVCCLPVSLIIVALWRPAVSVPLVLVGAQMFLPPVIGFQVVGLPVLDKDIIAPLSALLGCLIFRPKIFRGVRPGTGIELFIILKIVGLLGSWLTNRDPLVFPLGYVPPLSVFTFGTNTVAIILYWWPTVFLGRAVIRTSRDLRTLMKILAGAAVIYALPMLAEMRLSPMLNVWTYGYMQHEFIQTVRDGHYRPMVFMRHGLNVAFFMCLAIMAAAALTRIRARLFRIGAGKVTLFLMVMLVASHSLGALLYIVLAAPLIFLTTPRTQARVAGILGLLMVGYPVLRATGLVPVEEINAFTLHEFGKDRAGSLGLRLTEEEYITKRTLQRPIFGWGIGSRPFRLDPLTGKDRSTTDGAWAIEFGQRGFVGFFATFGMLLFPVWKSRRGMRKLSNRQDQVLVAALAMMGAIYLVDQIPNSTVDPYATFLVAVLSRIVRKGLEDDLPHAPGDDGAAVYGGYPEAETDAGSAPNIRW